MAKVNGLFLDALFVKLSSLLCLSFPLQDDTEWTNKREAVSPASPPQPDTVTQQHTGNSLCAGETGGTKRHLIRTTRLFLMLKQLAVLLYWKETGFDSDVCIVGRRTMTSVRETK